MVTTSLSLLIHQFVSFHASLACGEGRWCGEGPQGPPLLLDEAASPGATSQAAAAAMLAWQQQQQESMQREREQHRQQLLLLQRQLAVSRDLPPAVAPPRPSAAGCACHVDISRKPCICLPDGLSGCESALIRDQFVHRTDLSHLLAEKHEACSVARRTSKQPWPNDLAIV